MLLFTHELSAGQLARERDGSREYRGRGNEFYTVCEEQQGKRERFVQVRGSCVVVGRRGEAEEPSGHGWRVLDAATSNHCVKVRDQDRLVSTALGGEEGPGQGTGRATH